MYEHVQECTGKMPGPTSVILAGVHGDERCGVEAFAILLPSLRIERGTVIFVYGNPRAIEKNVRETEQNLNRMFKPDTFLSKKEKASYEYGRAQVLKTYLDRADVLLDVHSSATPGSTPFLIAEGNARPITEKLPIDLVVSGFDDTQPGGTDYYMNKEGKIGICAECGDLNDPASTNSAVQIILSFLSVVGHMEGKVTTQAQTRLRVSHLYYARTESFVLTREYSDFEKLSPNTSIGIDGDKTVCTDQECFILFAENSTEIGKEVFLLGFEEK